MADEIIADDVQPEAVEGQGGESAEGSQAPYADYLSRIPEEVRGDVEPVFRDWDANVTKRFQEASEYRKGWEPYEQIGVNQHDPATVQWALQFAQAAQHDPQSIQQWFENYAQERGLTPAQAAQELEQQSFEEMGGYGDPDAQRLEQLLQQQLQPLQQQLQQMTQWQAQQEYGARMAQATQYVNSQMEELKSKHPDEFDEKLVEKLLPQYIETDPVNAVQRAFEDSRAIRNQIEHGFVKSKTNQPDPALSGGPADLTPPPVKSLKEAEKLAIQQFRADRAA